LRRTRNVETMIARHASLRRYSWGAPRDAEKQLKIGYVSPDLLSTHIDARFTPSPRLNPKH
jgi:phage-related protein